MLGKRKRAPMSEETKIKIRQRAQDKYIETKGYWSSDSYNKFKLFQQEYPNIKIEVLMQRSKLWKRLTRKYKHLIPLWES